MIDTYSDVEKIYKTFMNTLGAIRNLCPETKICVSPILRLPDTTVHDPRVKRQNCAV